MLSSVEMNSAVTRTSCLVTLIVLFITVPMKYGRMCEGVAWEIALHQTITYKRENRTNVDACDAVGRWYRS